MPKTRIIITEDGKVIIEGIGYIGDECIMDLTRIVNELKTLGVEVNIQETKMKEEGAINEQRIRADNR